jgi:quercetin dioxygenase-like cupin family protein
MGQGVVPHPPLDFTHLESRRPGKVLAKDGDKHIQEGDFAFILPNEEHGFENTGDRPFRFVCVIPIQTGTTDEHR